MKPRQMQALVAVSALLLGLALWLRHHASAPASSASPGSGAELAVQPAAATAPNTGTAPAAAIASAGSTGQVTATQPRLTPQRRQLRERVTRSLRDRERKRAGAAAATTPAGATAGGAEVGTMVDKSGELTQEEMHILNHELMPLIGQCLDQAHERNPELKGMLAIELRFTSAEGLGSIVETAEPATINDLGDPELLECARQSAFTLELPVPATDRRMERMLTIPYGIDPKEWRPRAAPAEQRPASAPASQADPS